MLSALCNKQNSNEAGYFPNTLLKLLGNTKHWFDTNATPHYLSKYSGNNYPTLLQNGYFSTATWRLTSSFAPKA